MESLNIKLIKLHEIVKRNNNKMKLEKAFKLWKEETNRCRENCEMGMEDVYSKHIRKMELDKIKKKDLLIKWKSI